MERYPDSTLIQTELLIYWFFLPSVGLERILKLLSSEDIEVQMHALKMVANLAAEGNLFISLLSSETHSVSVSVYFS